MTDETPTETPPAKKTAKKAAAAAPKAETPQLAEHTLFSDAQAVRLRALREAADLLDDGETRGTAGELLTLARWVVGTDQADDGEGLTFIGAPQTTGTTNPDKEHTP